MTEIRFIHTADLHLDSPFKGMTGLPSTHLQSLRNSTFAAFSKLITFALESKPDFIIIAGDIYDGEERSLRAQMKFQQGMEQLNQAGIPVFISYGNHDHLSGRWTRFELPSNVHVFNENVEETTITIRGQEVSIIGFSYKERHVREAVIDRYPEAEQRERIHIGLLHGSLAGDETHEVYAPFTRDKLLSKQYDYWALGHIHLRQQLHTAPPIVYPGNLQGRHRNEKGQKGFYEVVLSKSDANLNFIPASDVIFDQIEVSCSGIYHANEWVKACQEVVETFRENFGSGILELSMVDIDVDARDLFSQSTQGEWLELIREMIGEEEPFIWIQKIHFNEEDNPSGAIGALAQSVISRIEEWEQTDWKHALKDVYQHARGMKYLDVLSEEEIEAIKVEAKNNLITEMSKAE